MVMLGSNLRGGVIVVGKEKRIKRQKLRERRCHAGHRLLALCMVFFLIFTVAAPSVSFADDVVDTPVPGNYTVSLCKKPVGGA